MAQIISIEDDELTAQVVSDVLSAAGHSVTVFSQGTRGLEAIAQNVPDLVILDLQLPGLDGLDVLRMLRIDHRTARIPVLVLTANRRGADTEAATAAGADRVMLKPFSANELMSAVDVLLSGANAA